MSQLYLGGRFTSRLDDDTRNSGGQLWTLISGTTGFLTAYVDSGLTTPCTYVSDGFGGLYIELDARGETQLWLGSQAYTFLEKDADGALISTTDGVLSATAYTDAAITTAVAGVTTLITNVPTGAILDYGKTTVPSGYLQCNGNAVSRSTYADLFAVIGTTWGPGNGTTTFNLPDFSRRVSVGSGGSGTATLGNVTGNTGGEETHTLITAEMPAHAHTLNDSGHAHTAGYTNGSFGTAGSGTPLSDFNSTGTVTFSTSSETTGITIADAGADGAHNNMQPSAVVTKMIKT